MIRSEKRQGLFFAFFFFYQTMKVKSIIFYIVQHKSTQKRHFSFFCFCFFFFFLFFFFANQNRKERKSSNKVKEMHFHGWITTLSWLNPVAAAEQTVRLVIVAIFFFLFTLWNHFTLFSSRKGKKLYKTPSVKYNVCTNKKLTQVCLQNVKFLFFFFLNYSQKAAGNQKGSCRSRASNPWKPPQNN